MIRCYCCGAEAEYFCISPGYGADPTPLYFYKECTACKQIADIASNSSWTYIPEAEWLALRLKEAL